MRIVFLVISSLLFFLPPVAGSGDAGKIRIYGKAPGYAGEQIVFHTWKDQLAFAEQAVFSFTPDEDDTFSVLFDAGEGVAYIFAYLGIYYCYMFIEPGMEYQVILPAKAEKSEREKLNPYFDGIPTHIAVVNHEYGELNSLVNSFDRMYEPLFGESLIRLSLDRDRDLLDSIQGAFDQQFGSDLHPYFITYRRYKMALLRNIAQMQQARSLSDNYFRCEPVLYDHIAYMELFNQVYNKYFLFFSRTGRGSKIFDDINKYRSITRLRNTLYTDPVLGEDRLLELVILKGLHDAFYGSDFSRSGILVVLDSLAATTQYPEHLIIAGNIRDKVTSLLSGFEPPEFNLVNRLGDTVSLADYRGYYVYLNFCTGTSYGCLSEYDVLKKISDSHGEYLRVITVYIDENYESMLGFLGKNDYDWEFLFYGNQPSVLQDYDIRIFPTYYLMDRDGRLLISPAPSPAENFENYLLRTMRSRGELR